MFLGNAEDRWDLDQAFFRAPFVPENLMFLNADPRQHRGMRWERQAGNNRIGSPSMRPLGCHPLEERHLALFNRAWRSLIKTDDEDVRCTRPGKRRNRETEHGKKYSN